GEQRVQCDQYADHQQLREIVVHQPPLPGSPRSTQCSTVTTYRTPSPVTVGPRRPRHAWRTTTVRGTMTQQPTGDESMSTDASRERAALCDLLSRLGPDQPTLCEGWTTRDLAAHLLLRERRPL